MPKAHTHRKRINVGGEAWMPLRIAQTQYLMSRYTNFAVVGAGTLGNYIVQQFLKDKAAGIVKEVAVLTRQVWCSFNNYAVRDIAEYP